MADVGDVGDGSGQEEAGVGYTLLAMDMGAQTCLLGDDLGVCQRLQWRRPTQWNLLAQRYCPLSPIRFDVGGAVVVPGEAMQIEEVAGLIVRKELPLTGPPVYVAFDRTAEAGSRWIVLDGAREAQPEGEASEEHQEPRGN